MSIRGFISQEPLSLDQIYQSPSSKCIIFSGFQKKYSVEYIFSAIQKVLCGNISYKCIVFDSNFCVIEFKSSEEADILMKKGVILPDGNSLVLTVDSSPFQLRESTAYRGIVSFVLKNYDSKTQHLRFCSCLTSPFVSEFTPILGADFILSAIMAMGGVIGREAESLDFSENGIKSFTALNSYVPFHEAFPKLKRLSIEKNAIDKVEDLFCLKNLQLEALFATGNPFLETLPNRCILHSIIHALFPKLTRFIYDPNFISTKSFEAYLVPPTPRKFFFAVEENRWIVLSYLNSLLFAMGSHSRTSHTLYKQYFNNTQTEEQELLNFLQLGSVEEKQKFFLKRCLPFCSPQILYSFTEDSTIWRASRIVKEHFRASKINIGSKTVVGAEQMACILAELGIETRSVDAVDALNVSIPVPFSPCQSLANETASTATSPASSESMSSFHQQQETNVAFPSRFTIKPLFQIIISGKVYPCSDTLCSMEATTPSCVSKSSSSSSSTDSSSLLDSLEHHEETHLTDYSLNILISFDSTEEGKKHGIPFTLMGFQETRYPIPSDGALMKEETDEAEEEAEEEEGEEYEASDEEDNNINDVEEGEEAEENDAEEDPYAIS
ncbi:uncharacterized protein MONOS_12085 [Monocercomonoides exilis]|uniref:uncharacterized protein n=1 Tax=Monocercomonoides exilis TaxID=2049356 RepID=UPI003559D4EF|nr:hypothetical protein MONOS_12085 [Monocercomonoides exilis]|eukprot:MONOS_12085.1-p1 / transcript=MONOS_12085.1 / gene=MONOS_12085 / organism=Monocercomonoides_exilis_PA203 / gene_product=unspecified product / transcript_product=unspecified product / location=Mono_scaffold00643:31186-33387(-) / protein_length=610 / sequence_SO=supercontig / SO=protein_coding / is_pseudo=false